MTIIEQLQEKLENEEGITLGEDILPYVREAISTAKRETLREVVGIVEKQKKRIPAFDSETGRRDVYAQALDDIITHLESELTV